LTTFLRSISCLAVLLIALVPQVSRAQTPSPLQEWQYSGGIVLARLFDPNLPEWRVIAGAAADVAPPYDGARASKVSGGPVFNVYFHDIAYFTTGDGLGVNFIRGDHYQIGAAMGYDLGRKETLDWANLHGMGNIPAAPVAKLYGTWVLSKKFPLILRVAARQFIGGDQGAVGDASVYMPLPGSSKTFVMFAGPSITMATRHYMNTVYGVSAEQSLDSGHPAYDITRDGTTDAGVGFSATKFLGEHWLLNLDSAISQIRGTPARSPLVERKTQRVLALSFEYHWQK
jgi:outer membrane scaffolding protein for murein synthesis (MipA/OmpV family)